MKDFDLEERVNRAVQNFEAGYNCAQSVFLAYSDIFELDMETAKKMSVSFGGGAGVVAAASSGGKRLRQMIVPFISLNMSAIFCTIA